MNIVFITINDVLFLPTFFKNFLSKANPADTYKALIVQPIYKNETIISMARKYLRTFGLKEFLYFTTETVISKLQGMFLQPKKDMMLHSVTAVLRAYDCEFLCIDKDVNESPVIELLRGWNTDIIISVGCPQLFKENIINLPKKGCLNLHGAPLPKYRGVLPSFWMLKNNEKYACNTLFFVNETIDGGDIILQESFPIERDTTLRSLIMDSKFKASEMVLKAVEMIRSDNVVTRPIEVSRGSYFGWPSRKDVLDFLACGRRLR